MNVWKALSKQLFGARYERIKISLTACMILFLAVHISGIKVEIAPFILFLTATAFSAGIMLQVLNSSKNADDMVGLFMLPFANSEMTFSLVLTYTGYILITKTFPVLTLFFAVGRWSALQIAMSLFCAWNGCLIAAAWYTKVKVDAYLFYHPVSAKHLFRHKKGTGNIFLYLLRYLLTNKNYLINTAGLCVIAGVLPFLLGQFGEMNVMPLGFAILCLNTPICILLSCDPDLEQAVRVLPGQARSFCIHYCLFIFSVNMIVSSVYLTGWQMQYGGVGSMEIVVAFLFALQSAILSVLLEWLRPIRNWKIESDLWHHPRKYIVPLMMMLFAGFVGMWSVGVWVLLGMIIVECFSLSFIIRRI